MAPPERPDPAPRGTSANPSSLASRTIRAIVPTSYGSTAALVNQADLVLPILDREATPPAPIAAAYAEVAPWFEECHCPIDPAGLTLGRQLFWLSHAFPDEFGRARWILPFAQYWAWGLTGVPAGAVDDKEGVMSKTSKGNGAVEEQTPAPVADPFGDVHLETTFGKHVERILAPFLAHGPGCDPASCSCGLAAAVAELKRTEVMALRYGV